jgi:hypothetical protein
MPALLQRSGQVLAAEEQEELLAAGGSSSTSKGKGVVVACAIDVGTRADLAAAAAVYPRRSS